MYYRPIHGRRDRSCTQFNPTTRPTLNRRPPTINVHNSVYNAVYNAPAFLQSYPPSQTQSQSTIHLPIQSQNEDKLSKNTQQMVIKNVPNTNQTTNFQKFTNYFSTALSFSWSNLKSFWSAKESNISEMQNTDEQPQSTANDMITNDEQPQSSTNEVIEGILSLVSNVPSITDPITIPPTIPVSHYIQSLLINQHFTAQDLNEIKTILRNKEPYFDNTSVSVLATDNTSVMNSPLDLKYILKQSRTGSHLNNEMLRFNEENHPKIIEKEKAPVIRRKSLATYVPNPGGYHKSSVHLNKRCREMNVKQHIRETHLRIKRGKKRKRMRNCIIISDDDEISNTEHVRKRFRKTEESKIKDIDDDLVIKDVENKQKNMAVNARMDEIIEEMNKSNSASVISNAITPQIRDVLPNDIQSSALRISKNINMNVITVDNNPSIINVEKQMGNEMIAEDVQIIEKVKNKPLVVTFADEVKEQVIIESQVNVKQKENTNNSNIIGIDEQTKVNENTAEIETKVDDEKSEKKQEKKQELKGGYYIQVRRERDRKQKAEYEKRFTRIYTKYNTSKLENVSDFVQKFMDNIHIVYEKVCTKYKIVPYAEYDGHGIATPTKMEKEIKDKIIEEVNVNDIRTDDKSKKSMFKFNYNDNKPSIVMKSITNPKTSDSAMNDTTVNDMKVVNTFNNASNGSLNSQQSVFSFPMSDNKKSKTEPWNASSIPMDFNFSQQTNDENYGKKSNGQQNNGTFKVPTNFQFGAGGNKPKVNKNNSENNAWSSNCTSNTFTDNSSLMQSKNTFEFTSNVQPFAQSSNNNNMWLNRNNTFPTENMINNDNSNNIIMKNNDIPSLDVCKTAVINNDQSSNMNNNGNQYDFGQFMNNTKQQNNNTWNRNNMNSLMSNQNKNNNGMSLFSGGNGNFQMNRNSNGFQMNGNSNGFQMNGNSNGLQMNGNSNGKRSFYKSPATGKKKRRRVVRAVRKR